MPPKEKEVCKISSSTRIFHCQLIFSIFYNSFLYVKKWFKATSVFYYIFDQDHNFHDFKNTTNMSKVSSINDVTVFSLSAETHANGCRKSVNICMTSFMNKPLVEKT